MSKHLEIGTDAETNQFYLKLDGTPIEDVVSYTLEEGPKFECYITIKVAITENGLVER